MLKLTKRFQKLIFLVTFVLIIGTISYNYNVHKSIDIELAVDKLKNSSRYQDIRHFYQEILNNYKSGTSSQPYNSQIVTNEDGTINIDQSLKSLPKSKINPKEILRQNVELFDQVMQQPITEPTGLPISRINDPDYVKVNAAFVSLVRNSELRGIQSTIKQIESTFNKKYNYPYVFLNDKPFSDRFKKGIAQVTKSEVFYELVPPEVWDKPDFIDPEKEEEGIKYLEEKGVGYSKKISYHNMCRYYSMGFYNHPRMKQFKYYWRLEPKTNYFCDIDYDVFKFMQDNKKVYGYVLNLYDSPDSVRSLWPVTKEFLKKNPQYLNKNAALGWLKENQLNPEQTKIANGYSTCHFWSNFEIGDMDFYRSEAYTKWMEHLEANGGFYYERWGDAPVHSMGLALFADKEQIHWFRDIGYEHMPYANCPMSEKCVGCKKGQFSRFKNLNNQNCQPAWLLEMSDEWLNVY
ncbi:putative mannosyltransferase KTR4 [Wickerhamomyces ciferrii]|uniref:Mannosyltransferase KTR4 n=1 Tax=Wickerhamomyces ciferrii (strain ATCC 14091 / BCRC 22168 / CBS 111 / JCM 3599 / NBRC 0793 / NRRL Y-1031 F-60-10) TaxID=1206466 RepID=K0KMG9_WICCF|nr:putative mannosyltransferase KTR4 [Wickerhamomyces ciferrii]CCH42288.1 putative mannosyltransferase KTR4 [Wickerhamomyces ciferrii]